VSWQAAGANKTVTMRDFHIFCKGMQVFREILPIATFELFQKE